MLTAKPSQLLPEVERPADALTQLTSAYWRISSILNGHHTDNMSTGAAIKECSALSSLMGPHRRLSTLTRNLSDTIVSGRRRKKETKTDNVRVLHGQAS